MMTDFTYFLLLLIWSVSLTHFIFCAPLCFNKKLDIMLDTDSWIRSGEEDAI